MLHHVLLLHALQIILSERRSGCAGYRVVRHCSLPTLIRHLDHNNTVQYHRTWLKAPTRLCCRSQPTIAFCLYHNAHFQFLNNIDAKYAAACITATANICGHVWSSRLATDTFCKRCCMPQGLQDRTSVGPVTKRHLDILHVQATVAIIAKGNVSP